MSNAGGQNPEQSPAPSKKRPTLYDVARVAGVSHQTVSQVVKNGPNVKPQTRQRVESAIAQLNYVPNLAARTLATAKSHRIAALFFDRYEDIGPTRNMQAAVDHARESGYVVDVIGVDPASPSSLNEGVELLSRAGVSGIVAFAPTMAAIEAVAGMSTDVPVVIDALLKPNGPSERFDGVRLAIELLAELGHKRIAIVSGPRNWLVAQQRLDQALHASEELGVSVVQQLEGDWTAVSGFNAGMLLNLEAGPTAVVCGNDQMALGLVKSLRKRGVSTPGDVSVVGFDDIREAEFFEPSLTTVSEDFEGGGRATMDALLSAIDPDRPRTIEARQPPRLVVRESTAAARG